MSDGGKQSYRDLKVWRSGVDLTEAVFRVTDSYPKSELYGLVSQMRRCASSVPANIAEGCARKGAGEFVQFLHIAAGSLAELDTFLEIGRRLEYGDSVLYLDLSRMTDETGKMLYGLINSVKQGARK